MDGRPAPPAFRPDIEGLRALAIGAVLLDHAGVPGTAGGFTGVDVFFVISGFLITRGLVGELERRDGIAFTVFYARRVKRLLPSAIVVLAAVVAASAFLISPVQADTVAHDVMAAGGYVMNLRLASESVDYFAVGTDQSPLQHFWSLAVEEQFYLVWPAILLLGWRLGRRRPHAALWGVLGVTAVASFAYATATTADTPTAAYFSTPARVWELALGGLLALALARRAVPVAFASPLAWAGVGSVVFAVVVFDDGTRLPGPAALVPVLGAAALIAAGAAPTKGRFRPRPVVWLERGPMQWVGRRSYTWYLWHWPVLVVGRELAGGTLSASQGVGLALVSLGPTMATHAFVEEPLRRSRVHRQAPWRTVAAAPAGAAAALALGVTLILALPSPPTLARADVRGAHELEQSWTVQTKAKALRPAPRDAAKDRSRVYDDGCLAEPPDTKVGKCVYVRRHGDKTVVLLGDSHAMQYFPAMERIARARGWRLVVLTKAGCTPASVTVVNAELGRTYRECDTWRERALDRVERERPDLVVAAGATRYDVVSGDDVLKGAAARTAITDGYVPTLERMQATGAEVRVLREAPRPPQDIPVCVAKQLDHLKRCAFPQAAAVDDPGVEHAAVARVPGVEEVDVTSRFCRHGLCPAVIGDALVYRNAGHVTATYARTLAAWLGRRLPR